MANDNLKSVRWADGQGITHGDLNDAQRFNAARLFDALLEKLIPGPGNPDQEQSSALQLTAQHGDNVALNQFAYTLHGGQAYPRQGTANNKVQIAPGTLLQKIAARDGNEPTLLCYTFTGTEEVTLSNGDATHPRVDLVQMKLEWEDGDSVSRDFEDAVTGAPTSQLTNIKRRVKCTLSVKQGTPAASPAYPTPDAGCVVIAGVVVPNGFTWATALDYVDFSGKAILHDQRMPLGAVREYHVLPTDIAYDSTWTLSADRDKITANGGGGAAVHAICPGGGKTSRIVGIRVVWSGNGGSDDNLARIRYTTVGRSRIALNSTNCGIGGVGSLFALTADHTRFESTHTPNGAGPVIQSNGVMGPPVWTSGKRAVHPDLATYDKADFAGWMTGGTAPATTDIRMITFLVAEGI